MPLALTYELKPFLKDNEHKISCGVTATDRLTFWWELTGQGVALEAWQNIARRHELWRHTCFEAFFGDLPHYFEINISPSGGWNVYEFTNYRFPQPPQEASWQAPEIHRFVGPEGKLRLDAHWPQAFPFKHLLLCAVTKTAAGLNYWSLAHGPTADFHKASLWQDIANTGE